MLSNLDWNSMIVSLTTSHSKWKQLLKLIPSISNTNLAIIRFHNIPTYSRRSTECSATWIEIVWLSFKVTEKKFNLKTVLLHIQATKSSYMWNHILVDIWSGPEELASRLTLLAGPIFLFFFLASVLLFSLLPLTTTMADESSGFSVVSLLSWQWKYIHETNLFIINQKC